MVRLPVESYRSAPDFPLGEGDLIHLRPLRHAVILPLSLDDIRHLGAAATKTWLSLGIVHRWRVAKDQPTSIVKGTSNFKEKGPFHELVEREGLTDVFKADRYHGDTSPEMFISPALVMGLCTLGQQFDAEVRRARAEGRLPAVVYHQPHSSGAWLGEVPPLPFVMKPAALEAIFEKVAENPKDLSREPNELTSIVERIDELGVTIRTGCHASSPIARIVYARPIAKHGEPLIQFYRSVS